MPAKSNKQQRFMGLVHGIQTGKVSRSKVGGKALKAADSINPKDVKDFLMECFGLKECGMDIKQRILKGLQEVFGGGPSEPMNLEASTEATPNVIASNKTLNGDYDKTMDMYRGIQFTSQEAQAINNFTNAKPTKLDKFSVRYDKADSFGNNTDITVKKLQDAGKLVFVAFLRNRSGEQDEPNEPSPEGGPPPEAGQPDVDEIEIIKSTPIDDHEGSEILTNFLQAVYHEKA